MYSTNENFKLTLKFTDGRELSIDADCGMTIYSIRAIVQADTEAPSEKIKLVYKGKITTDGETLKSLGITKPSTIIVVINKFEKAKPVQQPKEAIPTNFQTGLGNFNPVGFGNYGVMNHPQYMSALSGLNEDKVEEMMDDPFYASMIEELLKDPETMVKMMEENPVTKKLMDSNPMMKMMMSNPETLKMIINPETMKKMKEMKKNGGPGLGGLRGMAGLGGAGGLGSGVGNPGVATGMFNPMNGFGWPQNPGMPPAFQPNQAAQQPSNLMPGIGINPLFGGFNPYFGMGFNPLFASPAASTQVATTANPPESSAQYSPAVPKSETTAEPNEYIRYESQIKRLEYMGFSDKEKMLSALRKAKGNLDDAIDYLDE